ncbi:glycosyltransferase [Rathayibacter soli]|uniref:glycosyltransferase n=1 Tax=Rathayibacter soli TaxID=3144168 RepID=UPI0027E5478A|nr:glycosyltransferase [Glaciibacter superstes]
MTTMVYHAPYPLNAAATSASGIRPVRMLEAFRELGYNVLEVTGYSKERKRGIRRVKEFVRSGGAIAFAYAESSTMPTTMTDPHHLPLHPFLDAGLFRYLKRQRIPLGVFYRDVYWKFPEYLRSVNRLIAIGTRTLYRYDLLVYRRWATRVYLPSLRMAAEVPLVNRSQHEALPPGCIVVDPDGSPDAELTVFYVGGLGDYYRLHEAMRGVGMTPGSRLIVCTAAEQWQARAHEYNDVINRNVEIVHARGAELEQYYQRSSLCSLFLEPIAYREFAAPMKLYEYIGHGRPVIASEGTLSAKFISENELGWALPYRAEDFAALLAQLRDDADVVQRVALHVQEERHKHTWVARARQVAEGLSGHVCVDRTTPA